MDAKLANAIPDLREELDRKCFATSEWLVMGYENANLTLAQFSTGMDTLFMCSAGLVDSAITNIATQASLMVGAFKPRTDRHFIKGDVVVTLSMEMGDITLITRARKRGVIDRDLTNRFDTAKEAFARLVASADKLLSVGYVEL